MMGSIIQPLLTERLGAGMSSIHEFDRMGGEILDLDDGVLDVLLANKNGRILASAGKSELNQFGIPESFRQKAGPLAAVVRGIAEQAEAYGGPMQGIILVYQRFKLLHIPDVADGLDVLLLLTCSIDPLHILTKIKLFVDAYSTSGGGKG